MGVRTHFRAIACSRFQDGEQCPPCGEPHVGWPLPTILSAFLWATNCRSRQGRVLLISGLLVCWSHLAFAADHFLTIGGGDNASNNQVSLENNVLYLRRCLADHGLGKLPNEVLFTDGAGGSRDLEYFDPKFEPPRATELLAQLMGHEDGLYAQYRAHDIPQLWGASGRAGLGRWFDTVGKNLTDGDRLIIYFTGHGGHGKNGHESTLSMWNEAGMTVSEFIGLLDRVPEKVPVVLVMVQCFSGCFADVIYNGGDVSKGFSGHNRCGFFATSTDRVAAGCTPDVDEESYRDYTTYFWAGLFGEKRNGDQVPKPDFDHDGSVSLAEAHAYALINSDTIDLSMRTSDDLLRHFSKLTPGASITSTSGAAPASQPAGVSIDASYDEICSRATQVDRAVLDGLSERLKLVGQARVHEARSMAGGLEQRRSQLEQKMHRAEKSRDALRTGLMARLKLRWPELSNVLNPRSAALLADHGPQLIAAIESAPHWKEFEDRRDEIEKLDDESTDLERQWIKCQRFIQTAERVALGANLPGYATPEVQRHFHQLVEGENGFIASPALVGLSPRTVPSTQPASLPAPSVAQTPRGPAK